MLKKKFFIISLLVVVLITGCSNQIASEQAPVSNSVSLPLEQMQDEEKYGDTNEEDIDDVTIIDVHLDKYKSMDTVDGLIENIDAIITGKNVSSKTFFQNNMMYTISDIKVEQSLKGDIQVSDIISIVEVGGRTTYGEYKEGCNLIEKSFIPEEMQIEVDKEVVLNFDGFTAMEEGEEVLLFLVDSSGFIINFDSKLYSVVGDFDGKLYKQTESLYSRKIVNQTGRSAFMNETLSIDVTSLADLVN